jgi:hypothetical protein
MLPKHFLYKCVYICIFIYIYIYIYIHTQGLLESGIQFDASKTFPFQCGGGDVIKGLFVFKLLHECFEFLCTLLINCGFWLGSYVLRRTYRQDYETLFHVVILSKQHHHHHVFISVSYIISVPYIISMFT